MQHLNPRCEVQPVQWPRRCMLDGLNICDPSGRLSHESMAAKIPRSKAHDVDVVIIRQHFIFSYFIFFLLFADATLYTKNITVQMTWDIAYIALTQKGR